MFTCILRLNMDTKIGFIGLGLMGKPMVMRFLSAGYSVTVNNRSQSSVSELVSKGAINASTPKEVALSSDVVITMLPDAPDVEKVILDKNGLDILHRHVETKDVLPTDINILIEKKYGKSKVIIAKF